MIKVLKAGFFSSIQDKGRIGFASIGVPISGVMDAYAADIANSILNNSSVFIRYVCLSFRRRFFSSNKWCIHFNEF